MKTPDQVIKELAPSPPPKAKEKKGKAKEEEAPAIEQPRKPPEDIEAFYESNTSNFWTTNGHGHWQRFTTDAMTCMLKNRGYSTKSFFEHEPNQVEKFLHSVRYWKAIDWAGELAGWDVGVHQAASLSILITKSRKPIVAKRGQYPLMRAFLKSLLGPVQLPVFLGWLKGSLQSLAEGYPFRPGQLLAFCGKSNDGKSFLQELITYILGGRMGDPSAHLLGEEKNTVDFLRGEHLQIEDKALKDTSQAKRRSFAANLKAMVVNEKNRIRGMHRDAVILPVGTRVTLSCNDVPEALVILPALDEDVKDKVIYFRTSEGDLPMKKNRNITRAQQLDMFLKELPAFVWYLERHKINPELLDPKNRYTVKYFHNADIVQRLQKLTPEERLLYLIETLDVSWPFENQKTGTAAQIEGWLRKADSAHQLDRIINFTNTMGIMLSNIARENDERVRFAGAQGRNRVYTIFRDEF